MIKVCKIGSNFLFISAISLCFLLSSARAQSPKYNNLHEQIWVTNFLAAVQKDPNVLLHSALIGIGSVAPVRRENHEQVDRERNPPQAATAAREGKLGLPHPARGATQRSTDSSSATESLRKRAKLSRPPRPRNQTSDERSVHCVSCQRGFTLLT